MTTFYTFIALFVALIISVALMSYLDFKVEYVESASYVTMALIVLVISIGLLLEG